MGRDGFLDLGSDPVERVEARERILEHHADTLAADAPHRGWGKLVDALAVEQDFAPRDAAWSIDQSDDGRARYRFSGAGFAHHTEHLARHDVERDVVDGPQRCSPGRELDAQVADAEQGGSHRSRGLSASRSQSPSRLMATMRTASV